MKQCPECKQNKLLTEYHVNRDLKSGRTSRCKVCQNAARRVRYSKSKILQEGTHIRRVKERYFPHLSVKEALEEYNKLFELQNGKCNICLLHQDDLPFRLCVDHNHLTKKVRGLLCTKCNTALGMVGDNISSLKRAIQYIENNL